VEGVISVFWTVLPMAFGFAIGYFAYDWYSKYLERRDK
jgi:hypothetical protein